MMIRALDKIDIESVRKIHEKFYKDEFDFPDFFKNFMCAFLVQGEDGEIISAGGVRNIPEVVLITDKDFSTRERRSALFKILSASMFVCKKFGHQQLHAFVQDHVWEMQLRKVGFSSCAGNALYLEVDNG